MKRITPWIPVYTFNRLTGQVDLITGWVRQILPDQGGSCHTVGDVTIYTLVQSEERADDQGLPIDWMAGLGTTCQTGEAATVEEAKRAADEVLVKLYILGE